MGKDEIAIIRGHLQPSHVMLEWGAGGSTVYYPQFVAAYFSVEHDRGWFRKVKEALRSKNLTKATRGKNLTTVKLFHVPVKADGASKLEVFDDYINFPRGLGRLFDRVLIDEECESPARQSPASSIKDDGLLFVHDYVARPRYTAIEQTWLKIEWINWGQSLAVFRKRA